MTNQASFHKYYFKPAFGIIILIFSWGMIFSQDEKASLQKRKEKLEQEIEYTNKLLTETKGSRQTSLNELVILDNKIQKREDLITTMQASVHYIDGRIDAIDNEIDELSRELEKLKEDYAKMICSAYKNRNAYDRLMFVFSSEDFNQAYQRSKYFQQYNRHRKAKSEMIISTREELKVKISDLANQKSEKNALLTQVISEKQNLDKAKRQKNVTVEKLGKKERDLKKAIKEKERKASRFQREIEAIIAEEIRKAAEAANKAGLSGTGKSFSLTPEELLLSNSFSANKGKLPWPTERGIVSGSYGEHAHPVLKGIKVKNNGIDIITNAGSTSRAVFDGEVTRVISIPGHNNVVIIRHGEYLTVYSNLDKVEVKRGDKVKTKQTIGIIHTDEETAKTELHFELWKGKELTNPVFWIAKIK